MKDGTTEDIVGVKYFRLSWDLGGYNSKVRPKYLQHNRMMGVETLTRLRGEQTKFGEYSSSPTAHWSLATTAKEHEECSMHNHNMLLLLISSVQA